MSVIRTDRYYWRHGSAQQTSYALVDRVTSHEVATVTYLSTMRRWRWMRNTSLLLHGAEPADGISKCLVDAKKSVETGLPMN